MIVLYLGLKVPRTVPEVRRRFCQVSKSVRGNNVKTRGGRAALTPSMMVLVLALCTALTACGTPGGRPDAGKAKITATPIESSSAGPLQTGTGEPTDPPEPTATRGPELPVTPLPQTPDDPFASDTYPYPPELETAVRQLLKVYGTSLQSIYNAVNNKNPRRPYFYYDYGDMLDAMPGYDKLAQYILENGHGVCYHYASLTYYMLREAGYNACIIYGYRESDMALHYWTMVETENGWYHFDPLHRQMLLTDAEKSSDEFTGGNGLTWQAGVWPRSATVPYSG